MWEKKRGYDKNAIKWTADTIFGEYPIVGNYTFRDNFDIVFHPLFVYSYDKSIIYSANCGEYDSLLQFFIKASLNMYPLILKWNKNQFTDLCVSKSFFEPSLLGPLTGNFSDIVSLKNNDSVVIQPVPNSSRGMSFHHYDDGTYDTIWQMNIQFHRGSVSTSQKVNDSPKVYYSNNKFWIKGVPRLESVMISDLNGRTLKDHSFRSSWSLDTLELIWNPPIAGIYLLTLRGTDFYKTLKLYCD